MLQTKMEHKNPIMQIIHHKRSNDNYRTDKKNIIFYHFQNQNLGVICQIE